MQVTANARTEQIVMAKEAGMVRNARTVSSHKSRRLNVAG